MKDNDEKKKTEGEGNVTKITEGKDEQEPTQKLDLNAPPTHFAITKDVAIATIKFLEKYPHKKVRKLIAGIEGGTPLVLGPNPKSK